MRLQPIEQREVELRNRVVVDDVFRDAEKDPEAEGADQEPDGEMESEVFAARESCGEKSPDARVTDLELLEQRGPRGWCGATRSTRAKLTAALPS